MAPGPVSTSRPQSGASRIANRMISEIFNPRGTAACLRNVFALAAGVLVADAAMVSALNDGVDVPSVLGNATGFVAGGLTTLYALSGLVDDAARAVGASSHAEDKKPLDTHGDALAVVGGSLAFGLFVTSVAYLGGVLNQHVIDELATPPSDPVPAVQYVEDAPNAATESKTPAAPSGAAPSP